MEMLKLYLTAKVTFSRGSLNNFVDSRNPSQIKVSFCLALNPRSLEGGRVKLNNPLDFFGLKFLLLDRLSKALAQLFLVYEHIFRH